MAVSVRLFNYLSKRQHTVKVVIVTSLCWLFINLLFISLLAGDASRRRAEEEDRREAGEAEDLRREEEMEAMRVKHREEMRNQKEKEVGDGHDRVS